MIIDKNGNISVITKEKASPIELVKKIQALYPKFKHDNIIVSLTALAPISTEEIAEFIEISNLHKASKHSFVLVSNKVDLDTLPDQLDVVPTLQEAYDIIEMEDIERDLGF